MSLSRCGVSDFPQEQQSGKRRRKKRYVIGGWFRLYFIRLFDTAVDVRYNLQYHV